MNKYAPLLLRVSLSLVFLYFAISQLQNPAQWLGFLPDFTASLPIAQTTFVLLNGMFELVFGGLLLAGLFVRPASLLLGLHLLGIAFTIGFSALGIRDFGLAFATLSVFLAGADEWCLDTRLV